MSEWRSDAKPPHPPVEMPPCENCGYPREQHDPRDMSCHGGVMRYAPKIASLDRTWSGDSTTSRSRFDHSCRSHTMPKPAEPSAEVLAIVQAHHAAEPDCGVGDDLAARIKAYADQRVREALEAHRCPQCQEVVALVNRQAEARVRAGIERRRKVHDAKD